MTMWSGIVAVLLAATTDVAIFDANHHPQQIGAVVSQLADKRAVFENEQQRWKKNYGPTCAIAKSLV